MKMKDLIEIPGAANQRDRNKSEFIRQLQYFKTPEMH